MAVSVVPSRVASLFLEESTTKVVPGTNHWANPPI